MRPIRTLFASAGLLVACLAVTGLALARDPDPIADWPQLRGPGRDGRSAAHGLARGWPEGGPRVAWKRTIGAGFSGLSVVGGRLYTMAAEGEKEYAFCLDAATGKELWRFEVGGRFVEEFGDGPRSTPTVAGETVYVLGARGGLFALKAVDGSKLWGVDLPQTFGSPQPRWGFSPSPLVDGELLLLEVGGTEGRSLAALDRRTGAVRWTVGEGEASYSSPIAVDIGGVHQFVFLRRNPSPQLVSVLPDGKVYWTHASPPGPVAMPLFLPPDRIYVSAGDDAGALLVRVTSEGGQPKVEELWRNPRVRNHFNASVLVDGAIYGFDNATFKCISAATGEQSWAVRGLGKGSLVAADGLLYVLSDEGVLALVEANPAEYREKGRFQILTGRAWTSPSLAGDRLFVRDQDEIAAVDLAPSPDVGEIVARYTAARGGLPAWRAVEAMEWTGTYSTFSTKQPFTLLRQRPHGFRFESSTLGGPFVFGQDAAGPWWIWPLAGEEGPQRPEPPYKALLARDALLEPPLLDWQAKGHKLRWLGAGDLDGQPTVDLELTLATGEVETWHLDPATHLEVAVDSTTWDFTQSQNSMRKRAFFSDFRAEGGLVLPHHIEQEYGARLAVMVIEKVALSPNVDAARFTMPAVAAAPAGATAPPSQN